MDQQLARVPIVRLARAAAREEAQDFSIESEQHLLGALLADAGNALPGISGLHAEHFADERHRRIYSAIRDQAEEYGAASVDPVTVGERVARNGYADDRGYIAALAQATPSGRNVERYSELVRQHAQRRQLAAFGTELAERAAAPSADVGALLCDAENRLSALRPAPSCKALDWPTLARQEPPARRWAIRGWIGFGHTTLLVGPGGIGKTLLAQQIASCLALGRTFIDELSSPLRVFAWHCEDDADEMWRRQAVIARWLGVDLSSFADKLFIVPRHGLENALIVAEFGKLLFTPLIEELREHAADTRADVVILDNAAQLFGASENDRHAVTVFLNALAGALPGRAVLLLAHPARAAGSEFSGSSAWENVCRTRLYLGAKLPDQKADQEEPAAEDERYLARRKANYSAKDWRRFTFRDGVLIPDAIETSGGIVAHIRDQAAERTVLEGLQRLAQMGLTGTDGTTSPRFLPRLLLDYKLANGQGKHELGAAMRRLMLDGRLRRAKVGVNAGRHPVMGLEANAPTSR